MSMIVNGFIEPVTRTLPMDSGGVEPVDRVADGRFCRLTSEWAGKPGGVGLTPGRALTARGTGFDQFLSQVAPWKGADAEESSSSSAQVSLRGVAVLRARPGPEARGGAPGLPRYEKRLNDAGFGGVARVTPRLGNHAGTGTRSQHGPLAGDGGRLFRRRPEILAEQERQRREREEADAAGGTASAVAAGGKRR